MTWPWLAVALLCYSLVGAVVAHLAYGYLANNVIVLGYRDWGLRTILGWAYCLATCLLAGLLWPVAAGMWVARRRAASDGTAV